MNPSHPESRSVAGATIWCWVEAPTPERAEEVARAAIDAEDYVIMRREECRQVTRDEFKDHPESLRCFDEAADSGVAVWYLRWPV